MKLKLKIINTGPLGNNVCVLYAAETKKAIVIDPSFEPQPVLDFIKHNELIVECILLTHGHFDHFAGIQYFISNLNCRPKMGMHRYDLELLRDGGGSKNFHVPILPPNDPDFFLEDKQIIRLEDFSIEVRLAPGHSTGSVVFYISDLDCAICGDVIFYHGVGRTDLDGGSEETLMASIRDQIFTLPPQTKLIPGHGQETSVREEMENNPFLN